MLEHLHEIAKDAEKIAKSHDHHGLIDRFQILSGELDKLDVNDFLPDARAQFLHARSQAATWAKRGSYTHGKGEVEATQLIADVVLRYQGKGTGGTHGRNFAAIKHAGLREIIERDYQELVTKLLPARAWKSVVVMAGSILESLLYYELTADPAVKMKAMGSGRAPKAKGGAVIDPEKDEWKLYKLIEVAADVGVLNKQREDTIDQVLRDYRNFVHPKVEIKAAHPCTEAEAMLAKGALDGVLNHLKY